MIPNTSSKKKLSISEWLNDRKVIIALVISMISIVISLVYSFQAYYFAKEANLNSKLAIEIAARANAIALGNFQVYPSVDTSYNDFSETIELWSVNDLDTLNLEVQIVNSGSVTIDQIAVEIIGVPGPLYSLEPEYNEYQFNFRANKEIITLDEQLSPGGSVFVDLKSPIINYLIKSFTPPNINGAVYVGSINLVFSARKSGESLPIQNPGNLGDDRFLITLKFSNEFLVSEDIQDYLSDEIPTRIYPGYKPTPLP